LGIKTTRHESITFSNGDIYTILNQSEILRAYDGVPRLAKAQTIMGNRLMYGNYLEGYDLKDDSGKNNNQRLRVHLSRRRIGTV
jgi:hypothetical protein